MCLGILKPVMVFFTAYHESYCTVKSPVPEKCARRKDFGRGFYRTSFREQAVAFR